MLFKCSIEIWEQLKDYNNSHKPLIVENDNNLIESSEFDMLDNNSDDDSGKLNFYISKKIIKLYKSYRNMYHIFYY